MISKHLSGLRVISIENGEKLGTVDDIYFDPNYRGFVGFSVGSGHSAIWRNHIGFVTVETVHSVGPDALTITGRTSIGDPKLPPSPVDAPKLGDLLKRKVVTLSGTIVGPVVSVEFNDQSFALTGLEIGTGLFHRNRFISIDQVHNIGVDIVVVADEVCAEEANDVVEPPLVTNAVP